MSLLIVATYIVLAGFIIYLLVLLSTGKSDCRMEVRDNMLAPEEMQKHAAEMARNHPVGRSAKSLHWLIRRLNDNYGFIMGVHKSLNADIRESFPTSPAAEWLLDNFYIIEEQVKLIRRNLSKGHYSRLPVLKKGYLKGYPRVYAIALEMVAHSDGRIDEKTITDFINAYQSQVLLSMAELWAIPLMLRIALVECMRNICERIRTSRQEWHKAENLVSYITSHELDEQKIDTALSEQLDKMDEIAPSFIEHLIQKLRKHGSQGMSTVTALLDLRLREDDTSTEAVTGLEHQLQAATQVSIGNCITGLRLISDMDWTEIFELLSKVEHILRQDPCGIYPHMDFESRDQYRHEVEKLARAYQTSEINVADRAVECAGASMGKSPQDHVGYYLVGRGRRILLGVLGKCDKSGWKPLLVSLNKKPKLLYYGLIAFFTAFSVSFLMYYTYSHSSTNPIAWTVLAALLVLIPGSEFALNLVNTIASHVFKPTMLPKLELREGVPSEMASFVIVPTLLTNPVRARELLLQLEVYYLANREKNLFFALVGDFKDADAFEQNVDASITALAAEGIRELNQKYSSEGTNIFYYVHRKRIYNKASGRWMGWERKRGAIVEFNRLLRGSAVTSFSTIIGDVSKLPPIKYVITLDADTCLPMGAAKRLIGTISHPLNRAVINEETGIVCEGHGLLQPRISISIPGASRSLFTRIFAGQGGIDPYTTAVSDVYQDIFDEGIFTGKGIYEVDTFRKVLEDRIPDNTVLSHDLIEGCYLRAGLVSDIELVDGYPGRYNSFAARQHRWVRGDWQLLPWLFGSVRNREGRKERNNLSGLSKWKIIDNLRRSLLYPSILVLLLAGLGLLPGDDLVWIGFAAFITASPLAIGLLNTVLSGCMRFNPGKNNSTAITGIKAAFYQSLLIFMFIPFQAYLMLDAIIRTVIRVCITHRNMLEWVTAADVETSIKNNPGSFYRRMWFSIPAAFMELLLALFSTQGYWAPGVLIAALWLLAPAMAYRVSKPYERKQIRLSDNDLMMLRRVARKTWRYFEDFSGECENYLPPDNFQEDPPRGVAHRTSPTNIGLLLISIISAGDLGYIGAVNMIDRFDKIVATMEKLDKWKGHLYNWYNTVTLDTLRPLYVSTVDSGNLVGYMMVVREGLKEYLQKQVLRPSMMLGLRDTLALACEEAGVNAEDKVWKLFGDIGAVGDITPQKWERVLKELDAWSKSIVIFPASDKNEKNKKTDKSRKNYKINKQNWIKKLEETTGQYLQELYKFYPALLIPDIVNTPDLFSDMGETVTHPEDELFKPGSMEELAIRYHKMIRSIGKVMDEKIQTIDGAKKEKLDMLIDRLKWSCGEIESIAGKYRGLVGRFSVLIDKTEFSSLFDHKRLLFSIGYNAEDGHLSKSYYDLLASESRQASYIAIARCEVDRRHWIRLGRKLTVADNGKGLVSWTGTMFEYLMPHLIMRNYENSIFDETYSFVVRSQKKYGKQRNIPWGVSESSYSALDFNLNYQYKAFGVPELGLKRGLANDMVITPYASLLALGIDPDTTVKNLRELGNMGMDGGWGFYEAIDFTPTRLDKDIHYRIIKSFMAHHQGMSLAAINNFIHSNILQERFHANPVTKSAELLLQEKSPEKVLYAKEYKDESAVHSRKSEQSNSEVIRTFGQPGVLPPNVHILSNGDYSVMVTDGGSGYSMDGGMAVTRWSPDYFRKNGFYIFVRNINSNEVWSSTFDPSGKEPEKYRVVFSPDKAEFTRKDGNLETNSEITVSPEDHAEVRRISITNHSDHVRIVELTSYFEAVLLPSREDAAHPAFSKLFVRTEFVREPMCLLASRRQRRAGQKPLWMLHTMALEGDSSIGDMQYETDRMKFIGRNRDISNPEALEPDQPLGNSEGSVLDPVMCLRRRIRIEPGCTARAVYSVAIALSREQALELAEKYNDYKNSERMFELSWTRSRVEARYLGLDAGEAEFYLELVPFILYNNPLKREYSGYIFENTGAQPDLWPFGISGDLPVILVEISDVEDMDMVHWALKGHEYWRMKGLVTDLVFLVNKKEGYSQPLNDQIRNAIAASHAREMVDKSGGVFIRNVGLMDKAQIDLFYTVARLIVKDSVEMLKNDVKRMRKIQERKMPAGCRTDKLQPITVHHPAAERRLLFFNGIGGFSIDGREYVIRIESGQRTPAPWSNIIAGRKFGFLVTESGGGYTWAENSREYKLTPWSNDPVSDRQGEIFYINDTDEGCHWSLTPMPAGDGEPYTVRHGRGYSVFEHDSNGIGQSLTMFAAVDSPVKVCMISLSNHTGRKRNLSLIYYIRPVLGVDDNQTSQNIVTRKGDNGLLFIENKLSIEFKGKIAFMCTNIGQHSVTGDRATFFGLKGSQAQPAVLMNDALPEITGAGLDPCAAISAKAALEPEEEMTAVFLLGHANLQEEAVEIARHYLAPETAQNELERVKQFWDDKLEAIQIHTPDDSFDIMQNGWLMYQTISCRLWARSGYYQAGGAFGFRDQLQDSMAVLNTWPELTRNQILLHASRQYREGDVQHWWHAEKGKGIRTRYTDDLLWLAFVTAEYVEKTGDLAIMDEQIPFLAGNLLGEGEDEKYEEPVRIEQTASLYDHCVLAIDRALETGPHGIPLMGGGDWNDGMNTVGNKGRGESVWLGWFLISILNKFKPLCILMKDTDREQKYIDFSAKILDSIEMEAWDGSWYRRAYFDDGTPLGSVQNTECRIDSISQSWSVISGVARPQRMQEAMDAVQKYLIDRNEGIIKLLTPPFDNGDLQPGYIKGYVPGVRENGGQYTHAATWVVLAFAKLGMGDKAGELFHMLNPVNHTRTSIEYSRYKGEPYVLAADVYGEHPYTGRGGWTWYTGAAGWLYKVGLEYIAGFRKKGDRLYIEPCIPHSWSRFEMSYRSGKANYRIEVRNPDAVTSGVISVAIDGKPCPEGFVSLSDDGGYHRIEVVMGEAEPEKAI